MSIKNQILTQEEQAEYYRNIDRCADAALDQPISNALPEHACYLMTKMFSAATKQIRLYSGKLEQNVNRDACESSNDHNVAGNPVAVYSNQDLLSAVRGFLSKDTERKLQILVQTGVDGGSESHPLLSLISEMRNNGTLLGKVEIRQLKEKYLKKEDHLDVFEHHFMVMDCTAYRFEFDHNPCRAQANFGDSKTAKSLAELFDDFLFPAGRPLVEN